jgi:ABC-type nickel/cobalt efflux system permease component RcnA
MLHGKPLVLTLALIALAASFAAANPFSGGEEDAPARPNAGPSPFAAQQGDIKEGIATAFREFAERPGIGSLLAILGASFLYGLLHAAGPGHRKTVIFSLFLGRKAKPWEPALAGFMSAGIHAAAGLALLLALSIVRGAIASLSQTDVAAIWLDGLTLVAIAIVVLVLSIKALIALVKGESHSHGAMGKGVYSILALASLVPCPGAILVMMFALYMDAFALGVASFVAMSLGMGAVVSVAGYLAWLGREGLFAKFKAKEAFVARLGSALEFASYGILFAMVSVTAYPFLASLF